MNKLDHIQEAEYKFPYHHIPQVENKKFTQIIELYWGYEYLSYINMIVKLLQKIEFASLIDVGCGDGRLILEIQKQFSNKKLLGIDFSSKAIRLAKLFNPQGHYEVENVVTQKNMELYDVACAIEVIEHISPKEMHYFIDGLSNKIIRGGTLILSTPTDNLPVSEKHYQHFNLEKVNKLFEQNFILKEVFYLNSNSFGSRIIRHLFSNRFYAIKGSFSNTLYNFYIKHFFYSTKYNAKRILCIYERL